MPTTLEQLAVDIVRLLQRRGLTLAVAESSTGGLLGQAITEVAGASQVFAGGVIAYDNHLKERIGVASETIEAFGAVSAEVAQEMAQSIREWSGSEMGLAVTGIAGPGGGTDAKPVGTTYVAVADARGVADERHFLGGGRSDIRRHSAQAALELLRARLESEER